MAIVKQDRILPFSKLSKAEPFAAKLTIYTHTWEGKEDPREYLFFKTGPHTAITVDKRTKVHFLADEPVTACVIEKKKAA